MLHNAPPIKKHSIQQVIAQDQIDTYQTFGQIGWKYFSDNFLNYNSEGNKLWEHIERLKKMKALYEVIWSYKKPKKDITKKILNDLQKEPSFETDL
jgi:hypothetical protein